MIMSQSAIAKRFATAYVNVYKDDLSESVIEQMKKVVVFLKHNRDFMLLLCEGVVDKDEKLATLNQLLKHFDLPKSMQKLMEVLIKHKQLCELLDVLQDVCCLYHDNHDMLDVTIKTAHKLSDEEIEKFVTFFEKESQKKVKSSVEVDKELIAGVRLESNIFLWDYSVASRLRKLRQKLLIEG